MIKEFFENMGFKVIRYKVKKNPFGDWSGKNTFVYYNLDPKHFWQVWTFQFQKNFLIRALFLALLVSSLILSGWEFIIARVVLMFFIILAYETQIAKLKKNANKS